MILDSWKRYVRFGFRNQENATIVINELYKGVKLISYEIYISLTYSNSEKIIHY